MASQEEIWIERDYRDAWGNMRTPPAATRDQLGEALRRTARNDAARCFEPSWAARGERCWGVAAQLYGLRSSRNWGIGDFTDLQHLTALVAHEGADFVGVNPLHALYAGDSSRFSPYSPSSREFLNVLYIDPAAMQSVTLAPAVQRMIVGVRFQQILSELRAAELVNYAEVAACKERVFRAIFDAFEGRCARAPRHPLVIAFERFLELRGEAIRRFAIFQALSCLPQFGCDWRAWPADYHDPSGAAIAKFAEKNVQEIRYHAFLQWEADTQLAACAAVARKSEMRVGLYLDLAIGTGPESAESWGEQRNVVGGFHIGAPPDQWNDAGQDWGLAVYNPYALARTGYASLRRILAAVMRHAGCIRIDHVLGFQRLFLVPAGKPAIEGAYLHLPAAQICDALASESIDKRCLVVGEDLGTVPEDFPALLRARNILSCKLLIFGKSDGRFVAPDEYPAAALVAIGTHDLPPLLGFWSETDLSTRAQLGLFADDATRAEAFAVRAADKDGLIAALQAAGFPCGDMTSLIVATHGFLARTPCRLLLVQMEDVAMELEQPNIPASGNAHPNWRRKLSREVDDVFADPRAAAIFDAIRRERPRRAEQ